MVIGWWNAFALAFFLMNVWSVWRERLDPHLPLWLRDQLRLTYGESLLFLGLLALAHVILPPVPGMLGVIFAIGCMMARLRLEADRRPLPPLEDGRAV